MKTILFYSSVSSLNLFNTQKFYKIDIDILKKIGYNVLVSNKISDSLKFWKYDILFSYFYRYSFFPSIIAKCFGKRTYFTGGIDDLDPNYASYKKYNIQKFFFKLCYWVSNACIIVSKSDYNNISIFFHKKRKLFISEHAIDLQQFSYEVPKELIFSTVVWMGDVENIRRKGVDKALAVFSKLRKYDIYHNYKFYIIGKKGDGTTYINSLIEQYNLVDSVILTGEITEDEKIRILKRSKFYFQLSLYEGFGLAALEALCAKCILIHSGKGGLSNDLYKNHILFNIDDNFDKECEDLVIKLNNISPNCIFNDVSFYSIDRRESDFRKILKSD